MSNIASGLTIFDCGGVLIYSEYIACRLHASCLADFGVPIVPDEISERYGGINTTALLADLEANLA